jgi:hypothetical protein
MVKEKQIHRGKKTSDKIHVCILWSLEGTKDKDGCLFCELRTGVSGKELKSIKSLTRREVWEIFRQSKVFDRTDTAYDEALGIYMDFYHEHKEDEVLIGGIMVLELNEKFEKLEKEFGKKAKEEIFK